MRLDATSAQTYAGASEEGLFQFGHSKDHRPDLAQVKLSLATLDPLGWPASTTIVVGNAADDLLYEPEITRVRETTGKRGLLYVGDQKMAALATRALIGGGGDYYLCRLGLKQLSPAEREVLIEEFFASQHEPQIISQPETAQPLGVGFEITVLRTSSFTGGYRATWTERILVFSAFERAQREAHKLDEAVAGAQRELLQLNEHKQGKKRLDAEHTAQAGAEVVKRQGVEGIVNFSVETQVTAREVRAWKDRPARTEREARHEVKVGLDQAALRTRRQQLGWSCYATNHTRDRPPLPRAMLAYRGPQADDQQMNQSGDMQIKLQKQRQQPQSAAFEPAKSLLDGVRSLCLVQFVVRRQLATATIESEPQIQGLYPGQASRATTRPTTELMLAAFEGVSLMIGKNEKEQTVAWLTPLNELQQRILDLLGFSQEIYLRLVTHFQNLAPE